MSASDCLPHRTSLSRGSLPLNMSCWEPMIEKQLLPGSPVCRQEAYKHVGRPCASATDSSVLASQAELGPQCACGSLRHVHNHTYTAQSPPRRLLVMRLAELRRPRETVTSGGSSRNCRFHPRSPTMANMLSARAEVTTLCINRHLPGKTETLVKVETLLLPAQEASFPGEFGRSQTCHLKHNPNLQFG